ncbi:hypothetical protein LZC95_31095 [Pendulispora brunnea]|uniref:Tryptophan synthase alpha chain n=1 Tax=Pendulispora brunnea TaxID=2905690 RepID=A0ABZ2JYM3_9BACT
MVWKKWLVLGGSCLAVGGFVSVLASCLKDPREDDAVYVVDACDRNQLSADPGSPHATLRAFLESGDMLLQRATDVETEMKDACNAISSDLGLTTGRDVVAACKPIAARVDQLSTIAPLPPPGSAFWGELRFAPNCTVQETAVAECMSTCAEACDATKCEPDKLVGACDGECAGTCVTTGEKLTCTGDCVGEVPPGGPTTCTGECIGTCTGREWSGECEGGCAARFTGRCAGTCTGKCDGTPINQPDTDAGSDAGAAPAPGSPPPANADGNCAGTCVGVCSKGANGYCAGAQCTDFNAGAGPTLARFSGGTCGTGLCAGTCRSGLGTGTRTQCSGKCTAKKAQCDGVCVGECKGTRSSLVCQGRLNCGQNIECENACQARGQLAISCNEPKVMEVYAVSDPALREAWKKHGARLAKAISEVRALRNAHGFIGNRSYGDFVSIGLQGDLVRACVAQGRTNVASADTKISAMVNADPSHRRYQQ